MGQRSNALGALSPRHALGCTGCPRGEKHQGQVFRMGQSLRVASPAHADIEMQVAALSFADRDPHHARSQQR